MLKKLRHSGITLVINFSPFLWHFKPFFRRVSPYADEDWMYTESYRKYELGFLFFRAIFYFDESLPEVY